MYYVTMTDKFMSGWGKAQDKINKLVFECDTKEEAEIVAENAGYRDEMKYINITMKRPYYDSHRYYVSWKTKAMADVWFVKDYMKK